MSGGTQLLQTGEGAHLRVQKLRLQVSAGPDAGQELFTAADQVTIGSAQGNTLALTDPTVSRFHLALERHPEGYRARDLGSTNGTTANGLRFVEAYLPQQVTLQLGETTLRCEVVAEQESVPLHPEPRFGRLLGHSAVMRALFAQLDLLAKTAATVLVEGESGTGKELIAEALHEQGPREDKPFIVVDCGAIPADLVESELFGHEKGAFTGAAGERRGAFEAADGGTLFLDEIGELPLAVQPRLLRALERRQVKRVGSDKHRTVDVRFVAATHRDLRKLVNAGQFREDLYFRLAVAVVRVPPLRERPEDLPSLLEHLWTETFRTLGLPPRPYAAPSRETLAALAAMPWEGNVRELRNFVERSVALSGALDAGKLRGGSHAQPRGGGPEIRFELPFKEAKDDWVDHFERAYLAARLEQAGGNVSQMARDAQVDRAHLIKLLKKHQVR